MNEPPAGKAAAVRAIFQAVAPRYDFLNHLLSAGLDHRWRSRAARACGPPLPYGLPPSPRLRRTRRRASPGGTVLDVCCGTGDLAAALLRRGVWGRVVACDFSRPMLVRAQEKLAGALHARRAEVLEADALRLPLADGSVDAAASAFGLRNLADPARGLAEMVRVVRPGGQVVVLEFHAPGASGLRAGAFGLYFRRILPTLGRWISGGDRGGYQYLVESVEAFGPADTTARAMRDAGLEALAVERLPGGVAVLFAGRKPD